MVKYLSVSFGLHLNGKTKPHPSLQESIDKKVYSAVEFVEQVEGAAKLASGKGAVQGPEGSPASQTVQSAHMVLFILRNIQRLFTRIDVNYI